MTDAPKDEDYFCCESCGKPIKHGDKYTVTLDGCYLCENDAHSYQEAVDYWNQHAPENREERIAAHDCRQALDDHVANGGDPNDKPLTVMDWT